MSKIQNFNSIKVRLEQLPANPPSAPPNNFNSIKVRLEPHCPKDYSLLPLFQFHKGAIRTCVFTITLVVSSKFQFHKGAIRTEERKAGYSEDGISIP